MEVVVGHGLKAIALGFVVASYLLKGGSYEE